MTEVLFYHLERRSLEQTLPSLLEKCLERGWVSVVQVGSEERCAALDNHLWTYRDEAFLPHGTAADGRPESQPVWITARDDNPNGASVRFFADGAALAAIEDYERVIVLFDGNDAEALSGARLSWKDIRQTDHQATYWQQSPQGRWEKKA